MKLYRANILGEIEEIEATRISKVYYWQYRHTKFNKPTEMTEEGHHRITYFAAVFETHEEAKAWIVKRITDKLTGLEYQAKELKEELKKANEL